MGRRLLSVPLGRKRGTYLREAGGSSGTDGVMTLRHLTLLMREVGIKNWVTGSGGIQRTSVPSQVIVRYLQALEAWRYRLQTRPRSFQALLPINGFGIASELVNLAVA